MARLEITKKINALKDSQSHLSPERKKLEKQVFLSFILVTIFCIFSYYFIDRPVAILMSNSKHGPLSLSNFNFTDALTNAVYFLTIITMTLYVILRFLNIRSRYLKIPSTLCLGIIVAFFIKNQAQIIFGRVAPRYGSFEQLNFVRKDSLYGFHFMQMGSFPSGHMVIFTCVFLLLTFYYPKIRWLCYTLLAILACLLIYDNYHFVSDVVAGTYLGVLIAGALKFLLRIKSITKSSL